MIGRVVIGIVFNENDQVLIAKRPPDTLGAGKWEFPGGKIEKGEEAEQALVREMQEEVGIDVAKARHLGQVSYHYPKRALSLDIWLVERYSGIPQGCEGQLIAWTTLERLSQYDMLPATDVILPLILQRHDATS